MVLSGLQKNSFIDYPGKISCVLFLTGCNFDCPYCHNPDVVTGCQKNRESLDEGLFLDFLETHMGFLDGVVISGGEPTLQKDLPALCEKIKQMKYPVKLDTNGSRPKVIEKLINEGLIDYIAMDIKTDPACYAPIIQKESKPDKILSSIRIIMDSGIDYEFRTTCVKPLVDAHIIKNISKLIKGSMLFALQQFNNSKVLHPEFFRKNNRRFDDGELSYLQSVASPWVRKCIIR